LCFIVSRLWGAAKTPLELASRPRLMLHSW
jgi:hypothetical protein